MAAAFACMTDVELVEQSFEIAWSVLERSGELRERERAAQLLATTIIDMIGRGERRRLLLSNRAIETYRRQKRPLGLVT